jgi:hypothetical protein
MWYFVILFLEKEEEFQLSNKYNNISKNNITIKHAPNQEC